MIIWDNDNPTPYKDMINQVICGDCLDVMKHIPQKSIDIALTDPPYETEAHTKQRRIKRSDGVMSVEPLSFDPINQETRKQSAKYLSIICKKWALTFCQIEASHIWIKYFENNGMIYKRTGIWIKPDGMPQYSGDRPGMGYETIVITHTKGRGTWNGGGKHAVWKYNKNDNNGKKALHPTTKPRDLIRRLILDFSNEGDLIIDPFLGSGTTSVCCKQLGRNFIGIEKELKYCEIAERRLAQDYLF